MSTLALIPPRSKGLMISPTLRTSAVTFPRQEPNTEDHYPPARGKICMIQEGHSSKEKEEAKTLQTYTAATIKEHYYLCDSEVSITFSQKDHPLAIPRPGHAPLVLKDQIGGY